MIRLSGFLFPPPKIFIALFRKRFPKMPVTNLVKHVDDVKNELPVPWSHCASVSKRVCVQKFSYENEFGFHEGESAGGAHFM